MIIHAHSPTQSPSYARLATRGSGYGSTKTCFRLNTFVLTPQQRHTCKLLSYAHFFDVSSVVTITIFSIVLTDIKLNINYIKRILITSDMRNIVILVANHRRFRFSKKNLIPFIFKLAASRQEFDRSCLNISYSVYKKKASL